MAVIKDQFSRLQAALKARNSATLDSLASRDMTDNGMTVDSLLKFISGADRRAVFDRFGKYEILYNNKKARIDCPLVDTSGREYQAVTLTFQREKDQWKLKRFESGLPPIDTL